MAKSGLSNDLFLSFYLSCGEGHEENGNQKFHSRFYLADHRRCGKYYPCSGLHNPIASAWTKLVWSEYNTLLIQYKRIIVLLSFFCIAAR